VGNFMMVEHLFQSVLARLRRQKGTIFFPESTLDEMVREVFIGERGDTNSEKFLLSVASVFLKEGDNVIDAGSNHGQHARIFSTLVGNTGVVWCIEAARELCEGLERGAQASQHEIRVIQVALGDSTSFGEADFFRPSADQEGSLFLRSARKSTDAAGLRVEKVEVRSLDSFRLPANFIKIDVEGAERMVLEGARDTIHRHQPLICIEITRFGDSRLEYSPKAFLDQVDELGLILYNLVGVPVSLRDWENQDFFLNHMAWIAPKGSSASRFAQEQIPELAKSFCWGASSVIPYPFKLCDFPIGLAR
jgi:FkbM family methyltransferase